MFGAKNAIFEEKSRSVTLTAAACRRFPKNVYTYKCGDFKIFTSPRFAVRVGFSPPGQRPGQDFQPRPEAGYQSILFFEINLHPDQPSILMKIH